jgi:hypothetical protein
MHAAEVWPFVFGFLVAPSRAQKPVVCSLRFHPAAFLYFEPSMHRIFNTNFTFNAQLGLGGQHNSQDFQN